MYGPTWPFLFMYGSHDMRHTGFRRLTVVNGTPGGASHKCSCSGKHIHSSEFMIPTRMSTCDG